jgi:hypothetical protein
LLEPPINSLILKSEQKISRQITTDILKAIGNSLTYKFLVLALAIFHMSFLDPYDDVKLINSLHLSYSLGESEHM